MSKIILKKSNQSTKAPAPGDLEYGELALNYADGKLYYKKSNGTTIDFFTSGTGGSTGTVTSVAALTIGTTGTDVSSTVANNTTTPVITLNIPTASSTNRGALSAADWTTFNNKQSAVTTLPNPNAITFAASGGAAAGSSYTGAAVLTVDYSTVGAAAANHTHSYQAADADLLAIGGLTGTSGLLKKTAADTWTLDTTAYYSASNVPPYPAEADTLQTVTTRGATTSNAITLSYGTANGVAYLDASKVLTSGSTLTFDGTNFAIGSGNRLLVGRTSVDANNFGIQNLGSTAFSSGIQFAYAGVGASAIWVPAANSLAFGADASSGTTEQMRLTSTGLGIGTSSPAQKLTVLGDNNQIGINTTGAFSSLYFYSSGTQKGGLYYTTASEDFTLINNGTTGKLLFANNGAVRATIDSAGNLGLGVTPSGWTSGDKAFQVLNGGVWGRGNGLRLTGNTYYDGTNFKYIATDTAAVFAVNYLSTGFSWQLAPSGTASTNATLTQVMMLDQSGNLGLGATPSTWNSGWKVLQVGAQSALWTTGTATLVSTNAYNDGTGNKYLQTGTAARYQQSTGQHIWETAPPGTAGAAITLTQAMTLDASGRLGIGETSPAHTLSLKTASSTYIKLAADFGDGYIGMETTGDEFRIVTGQATPIVLFTNNTERVRIDSAGNLGIGTNSPGGLLDVSTSSTGNILSRLWNTNSTGTGSATFRIANSGNNAQGSNIQFTDNSYYVGTVSADRTNGMQFFVGQQASAFASERMRIDIAGNVGIGQSNPQTILHVSATNKSIYLDNLGAGNNGLKLRYGTNDAHGANFTYQPLDATTYIESTYATVTGQIYGDIYFRQNVAGTMTTRMTIKADGGNVGIGVASPEFLIDTGTLNKEFSTDKLRFNSYNGPGGGGGGVGAATGGGTSQGTGIIWKPNYGGYTKRSAGILNIGEGNYFRSGLAFYTNNVVDSTTDFSEAMRISSNGNVGIGTPVPLAKLSIGGGSIADANVPIQMNAVATTGSAYIGFNNAGGYGLLVGYDNTVGYARIRNISNTPIAFSVNDAEGMRLTTTGLGVGTTSPSEKLHVAGGRILVTGSGYTVNPSGAIFGYYAGGGTATTYLQAPSAGQVQIWNGGTSAIATFDANSNVGIGTATPAAKLHVSGNSYITGDTFGGLSIGETPTNYEGWDRQLNIHGTGNARIHVKTATVRMGMYAHDAWQAVSGTTPGGFVGTYNNYPVSFLVNATQRMVIDIAGNVGIGTSTPAYKLQVNGSFAATTKSFVIDHPTKPGMKLRYGSLEGPENGVYIRGRLKGNKVELPEYWTKLVDPDSITVNLTAIGKSQDIYVEDIIDNVVYVGGENVNCFYTVFAERVDVAKLEVEIE